MECKRRHIASATAMVTKSVYIRGFTNESGKLRFSINPAYLDTAGVWRAKAEQIIFQKLPGQPPEVNDTAVISCSINFCYPLEFGEHEAAAIRSPLRLAVCVVRPRNLFEHISLLPNGPGEFISFTDPPRSLEVTLRDESLEDDVVDFKPLQHTPIIVQLALQKVS